MINICFFFFFRRHAQKLCHWFIVSVVFLPAMMPLRSATAINIPSTSTSSVRDVTMFVASTDAMREYDDITERV